MFQRGIDVKEALGLGEFAPIVKDLRQFFEEHLMKPPVEQYWTNSDLWAPSINITDEIICKNFPDAGGGNVHKFVIWVHQMNNDPSFKENIKSTIRISKINFWQLNCSVYAVNYYITEKHKRKYDFPLDRKGLVVEIIYSKKK